MRASSLHRWLGVLALVALWLTLPLAAFAHGSDHGHRFCAEHGTIEEGSGAGSHAEATGGAAVTADAPASDDAHAECPLATAPTRDAEEAWVNAVASQQRPATVTLLWPSVASHPQLPLLLVAPKASPPAAS